MRIIVVCKTTTVVIQTAHFAPNTAAIEPAPAHRPAPAAERMLSSAELLRGHQAVEIEHLGTRYVLRATRSGKLILTK